jgi:mitochondrial GTPase 1
MAASARTAVKQAVHDLAHMPAATPSSPTLSSEFIPRQTYNASSNLASSYFLGHHRAALTRMQQLLSDIGLVIECRDFRVALSSWNPLLERTISSRSDRARIVVYTKRDLGPDPSSPLGRAVASRLVAWHRARGGVDRVVFLGMSDAEGGGAGVAQGREGYGQLLAAVKEVARRHEEMSPTGLHALVVGMPNAGKSTLLNRLRFAGVGHGKAAMTGAQPGVTRKIGTPVRIVVGGDEVGGVGGGVYIYDTPGVFIPHVPDREAMLKLALVGCVKDGLIPAITVVDYMLFRINLVDPTLYQRYSPPTNDVQEFLAAIARRSGKLGKGGKLNLEAAADWAIQSWRRGDLGRFVLDDVNAETLDAAVRNAENPQLSLNQAKKQVKAERKLRREGRRSADVAEQAAG